MERTDEQRLAGAGAVFFVMAEDEIRAAGDFALLVKDGQIYVERQASERDHDFQIAE